MNQNIITYLIENKEKYSKEALVAELQKIGYTEGDIAEGVAQVFGGAVATLTPATKTSFWNFKDKKVYTKASEKWADFLFGVFAPTIVLLVARQLFGFLLWPVFFILEIVALVYLYKRHRFMFYGLLTSLAVLPAMFVLFVMMISGCGSLCN